MPEFRQLPGNIKDAVTHPRDTARSIAAATHTGFDTLRHSPLSVAKNTTRAVLVPAMVLGFGYGIVKTAPDVPEHNREADRATEEYNAFPRFARDGVGNTIVDLDAAIAALKSPSQVMGREDHQDVVITSPYPNPAAAKKSLEDAADDFYDDDPLAQEIRAIGSTLPDAEAVRSVNGQMTDKVGFRPFESTEVAIDQTIQKVEPLAESPLIAQAQEVDDRRSDAIDDLLLAVGQTAGQGVLVFLALGHRKRISGSK